MSKNSETTAKTGQSTLRVEGSAAVARLQELLRGEPELKLEIVAARPGSPAPASPK